MKTPPVDSETDRVESWYSQAQERALEIDQEIQGQRVLAWEALSRDRQLELAEGFIGVQFAPKLLEVYSRQEKIKIAQIAILVGDLEIPQEGT